MSRTKAQDVTDMHKSSDDVDLQLRLDELLQGKSLGATGYGDQVLKINLCPCYELTIAQKVLKFDIIFECINSFVERM